MKFGILVGLTHQVTTIICCHMKKILLKEKIKEIQKIYGEIRPKLK